MKINWEIFFASFLLTLGIIVVLQLAIMWENYVAPHIRSWRYERKMEKARQEFLRGLKRIAETERKNRGE